MRNKEKRQRISWKEIKNKQKTLHLIQNIRNQMADFSRVTKKLKRKHSKSFKILREHNFQVRITSAANISFRCKDRIKTFSEMQVITTPMF